MGEDLRFAWPSTDTIFRLETTANPLPPVAWENATYSDSITNGLNTVRLPPTNSQSFFRLVAP